MIREFRQIMSHFKRESWKVRTVTVPEKQINNKDKSLNLRVILIFIFRFKITKLCL